MQQIQRSIRKREAEHDCQEISSETRHSWVVPNRLPENLYHDGVAGDNRDQFGLPVERWIEIGRELMAAQTKDLGQKHDADVRIKQSIFSD